MENTNQDSIQLITGRLSIHTKDTNQDLIQYIIGRLSKNVKNTNQDSMLSSEASFHHNPLLGVCQRWATIDDSATDELMNSHLD